MSPIADLIAPDLDTQAGPLVVTFRVARQLYALPLAAVVQVVRLPALTVVPDAPRGHCGLLNLRGRFLPVLEARALLGEPPAAELHSQVIIMSIGDARAPTLGLLVDGVETVRRYPPGSLAHLAGSSPLVAGMLREHDGAAVVLSCEALAARALALA